VSALRLALDTAVPLLALGGEHPAKEACLEVMRLVAQGRVRAVASVELVQEFAFHRLRRHGDPKAATAEATALLELLELVAFDQAVLRRSLDLVSSGAARGRDAVHAATALGSGVGVIVSPDGDFDGVPGLTRVDPSGLLALAGTADPS
jgi:predicted nucleic acid-binding protein